MDLSDMARRRRRFLLFAAVSAAAGYGAYRLYHHPSVARKRQTVARLAGTLDSLSDAAAFSADSMALISHDLNRFLRFGGEIPESLRHLAQLASSGEVSASLSRVSQAVTLGVLLGYRRASPPEGNQNSALLDRILDKLMSNKGSEFASKVTGSFARNLIVGFYSKDIESKQETNLDNKPDPKWVKLACSEPCKEAINDIIRVFVTTSITVFLDKTMHLNTFDDIFAGLTNPKHEAQMKEMLVSVCNGAVQTLVKTSHEVLTKPSDANISSNSLSAVSSTLAVPANRKFVMDVTSRVTFETVRSFLEFFLWKALEGARSAGSGISQEAKQVIKYINGKSILVLTICFMICFHVMNGMRDLVPV